MAATDATERNAPLLSAFAARVAALDASAWDRIGARCATLDQSTLGGLLGRAGLLARAFVPPTDPYSDPLARSTLATIGTISGLLLELSMLLGGADPAKFDTAAEQQHLRGNPKPQFEPFFKLLAEVQRQRPRHPGAAAALTAVSFTMLMRGFVPEPEFRAVYAPFEPEIPYGTILPGSEQHAA